MTLGARAHPPRMRGVTSATCRATVKVPAGRHTRLQVDSGVHPRVRPSSNRETRACPPPHRNFPIASCSWTTTWRSGLPSRVSLELEGADVAVAGDGAEAWNVLRADPLRCIIVLDLDMPVMDGWEFRRRQLLSSLAGIPVVVVSGYPDLAVAIRGMSARAAFRKPVELPLLLRAVNDHCDGH